MRRRAPQTALGDELRRWVSHNLRDMRAARSMSQADLSEASGVGRPFISMIECGRFSITLETLGALAQGLGTSPVVLLRDPATKSGSQARHATASHLE
jgi:transcriptional regulator with XRE-family HTH domain